jgi:hypothetical protein
MTESSYPLDKKRLGRPSSGKPIVQNASNSPENASYRLSPHVCTQCFGRLLTRTVSYGKRPKVEWRCAECGDSHVLYADETSPCWCSKHINTIGQDVAGFIFECVPNLNRSVVKNEFLVQEKKMTIAVPQTRLYRPAFSTSTDYL